VRRFVLAVRVVVPAVRARAGLASRLAVRRPHGTLRRRRAVPDGLVPFGATAIRIRLE